MEIKSIDFKYGASGPTAIAASTLEMNKWLKGKAIQPLNVETITQAFSVNIGSRGSEVTGVRLWYTESTASTS